MADTYAEQFNMRFRLARPAREMRSHGLSIGEMSVMEVVGESSGAEMSEPLPAEDALVVAVNRTHGTPYDMLYDGRQYGAYASPAGAVSLFDLRARPCVRGTGGFHHIHFHLPNSSIRRIAEEEWGAGISHIDPRGMNGFVDPVLASLANATAGLAALGEDAPMLALDHLLIATMAHMATKLSSSTARRSFARLPVQLERRAKELMMSQLNGGGSLFDIAEACDLPVVTFIRAFKAKTGVTPSRWLTDQRVDIALNLARLKMPLHEIALHSGFDSRAALQRVVWRRLGFLPEGLRG